MPDAIKDEDALAALFGEMYGLARLAEARSERLDTLAGAARTLGLDTLAVQIETASRESLVVAKRLPKIVSALSREVMAAAERASRNLYEVALAKVGEGPRDA